MQPAGIILDNPQVPYLSPFVFSLHVTYIHTPQRHLPKGSVHTGSQTCFPRRLPRACCTLIWSDTQSQAPALGAEVCDTAHTTTSEAWLHPQANKMFWRNKSYLHRSMLSRKNGIGSPLYSDLQGHGQHLLHTAQRPEHDQKTMHTDLARPKSCSALRQASLERQLGS